MPLHKKIFNFFLLLLPTQLSLHFWPSWSYVIGRHIDFLSPTIYLTDVLILLIIIICVIASNLRQSVAIPSKIKKKIILSLIIIIFVILNIFSSSLPILTFYKWLKILEFFLLSFYIIKNIDLKKDRQNIVKILSIGVIFESLLAIAQFISQSSINGIFYWVGERSLTMSTPNIAKSSLNGLLMLRPYATFPHPNALGGYLAVILPLILITDFKPMKIKWLAFIVGLSALFLTFSRPAILIGFLVIIISWLCENLIINSNKFLLNFFYQKKFIISNINKFFLSLIIILLLLYPILFLLKNISLEKDSIDRRISLNQASIKMVKKNPIFGVGLGNFIPNLPLYSDDKEVVRFLQPAHNIYLLILSETGIVGLSLFLILIFFSLRNLSYLSTINPKLLKISLLSILTLGLLDHYFITLQQTQLIFTTIVSLSLIKYPHEA